MGKYFGTDGFRGEANKDLTFEHAVKIGRFLGWYYGARLGKKAKIVIGKDTRRSSYMFESALCTGLVASGADAYIMHVTTTPSVAYITRVDDFDCGIMISASHNPFYDNGIKLLNSNGEKMDEETILKVEDYIDGKLEVPMAERAAIGRTVDYVAGRNRYIGYLISLSKFSFKNVKVGLDVANGAAWQIAKAVFDALGAKVYVINNQPDGCNINTDCGSTHIEHLQKFVVDNKLDIGFAFDGDADRCLCVDEKGNVVTGDHTLYIYGLYMKERGKLLNNKVVTTIMSNFGLYKALDKVGIEYEKTKVGDKYVYENMRRRTVRPHHLHQIRHYRRRHPHFPEADGSYAGQRKAHERTGSACCVLSAGTEECKSQEQTGCPERSGRTGSRCQSGRSSWRHRPHPGTGKRYRTGHPRHGGSGKR